MGQLLYGNAVVGEFDDRVLTHLKMVIFAKFRRQESLSFTWSHGVINGSGRSSIWLAPSVPIHFMFTGGKPPSINRTWIEQLMMQANSAAGLQSLSEPMESGTVDRQPGPLLLEVVEVEVPPVRV